MEYTDQHIKELWGRYLSGKATPQDIQALFDVIKDTNKNDTVVDALEAEMVNRTLDDQLDKAQQGILLREILKQDTATPAIEPPTSSVAVISIRHNKFTWLRYAAAVLLLIGVGVLWYQFRTAPFPAADLSKKTPAKPTIQPGSNRALLTLADGTLIHLDSAYNGTLAQQGNTQIVKRANGEILYSVTGATQKAMLNTMSTPKGGQYQLILPDGSKVWLNAASSITYPTAFSDTNREVSIRGEVYFEVAADVHRPFKVKIGNSKVWVLGTSFNISAYEDEGVINTTLVEGAVVVVEQNQTQKLQPGQQAIIQNNQLTGPYKVNVEQVTAWKRGLFEFNEATVQEIMNQVARWYDVEVLFEGEVPKTLFSGKIPRDAQASEVFSILEEGGIHIKITGKKVTIMP